MQKYILLIMILGVCFSPLMAECRPRSIVCPNGKRVVSSVCGSNTRASLFSCGPTTDIGAFKTFNRF